MIETMLVMSASAADDIATTALRVSAPKWADGSALGVLVSVALVFLATVLANHRRKAKAERGLDDRAVDQVDIARVALATEREYTKQLMQMLASEQGRVATLIHETVARHSQDIMVMQRQHADAMRAVDDRLDECERRHAECERLLSALPKKGP